MDVGRTDENTAVFQKMKVKLRHTGHPPQCSEEAAFMLKPTTNFVTTSQCLSGRSDKAWYSNPCSLFLLFSLLQIQSTVATLSLPSSEWFCLLDFIILLLDWCYLPRMEGPGLWKVVKMCVSAHFSFTSQTSDLMPSGFPCRRERLWWLLARSPWAASISEGCSSSGRNIYTLAMFLVPFPL